MKKLPVTIFLLIFFASVVYSATERSVTVKGKKTKDADSAETNYYALIIGNNNYKYLTKLRTAKNDAVELEEVLKTKYGFSTKLLLDVTRGDIITEINKFKNKLRSDDYFLLYYAGHGVLDKSADKAYWLPVDAEEDNPANWIIADEITAYLKRISSRHILIVSDSCYSGSFVRDAWVNLAGKADRQKYLGRMAEKQSRTLMASGGSEPVTDEGGGSHSVFAEALITGLSQIDSGVFTADELFKDHVRNRVIGKSEQTPKYDGIKNSGDEGGDFIFLARGSVIIEKPVEPEAAQANDTGVITITSNVSSAKIYLNGAYEGQAPVTKTLDTGSYEIEIKKDGYTDGRETVRVEGGKEKTINIIIDKAYGSIRVTSEPSGAKVYLDGAYIDITPNTISDLKSGSFMIEVKKDGYSIYTETVNVTEGQEMSVHASLEQAKKTADYKDPVTGMEFVFVKGGCYQMGDTFGDGESDEKPVHEVCVDDFYMGQYEVTQGQWKAIMGNNPSSYAVKDGCDNCPVDQVNWNDTQDFINKLNQKMALTSSPQTKYRLPTEAEWEYAARSGGKKEKWAGTSSESELGEYAWYLSNSGRTAHPVGQKKQNGLGLYDMSGNVLEWVQDWYSKYYYQHSPRNNPNGPGGGSGRCVLRGGFWNSNPRDMRTAYRSWASPGAWSVDGDGFRLLRTQ